MKWQESRITKVQIEHLKKHHKMSKLGHYQACGSQAAQHHSYAYNANAD